MELYRVNPNECIVYMKGIYTRGYSMEYLKTLIWLEPRYDGNYEIPRKAD
jgi:hypothetical protein